MVIERHYIAKKKKKPIKKRQTCVGVDEKKTKREGGTMSKK